MRGKLLTQDRILRWDVARRKNMNMMRCILCYEDYDSHNHLFFDCKFFSQVWFKIIIKAGMENIAPAWLDVVSWLCDHAHSNSVVHYVSRLLIAASTYFIWQERNLRLFNHQARLPDALCMVILAIVHYK